MQISEHTVVSMRFKMKNSRGEVLENIMEGPPIHYLHGSGTILPALEAELNGLKAGDGKAIFISKDQGYDGIDDEFNVEVIIDAVRRATEKELMEGLSPQVKDEYCGPNCRC